MWIFLYLFIFFWGGGYRLSLRNQTFFRGWGSFQYILGLYKVNIQNGDIFWAAKFHIFLGMPDITDFFFFWGGGLGVNSRCLVQAYV